MFYHFFFLKLGVSSCHSDNSTGYHRDKEVMENLPSGVKGRNKNVRKIATPSIFFKMKTWFKYKETLPIVAKINMFKYFSMVFNHFKM